jgi:hypothetical protein
MKNHTLRFVASKSNDVLEYRVRVVNNTQKFSYDAPYSIVYAGVDNTIALEPYSCVCITAADEFNESDILRLENTMARVGKRTLRFSPSASADAVGYRIYILLDGKNFNHNEPFVEIPDPKDGKKIEIDIGSLAIAPTVEGVYDTFVTAIDSFGNESDPMVIENSSFDFVAPEAPTEGEIV